MNRIHILIAIICYIISLAAMNALILFNADILLPVTVSTGVVSVSLFSAIAINLGLIALFGIQHSVMARQPVKLWMNRVLPAALNRAMFVLMSSVCLGLMILAWQPVEGILWQSDSKSLTTVIYAIQGFGWLFMFTATLLIDHLDLFGIKQTLAKDQESGSLKTPLLYQLVRHPIYTGVLIAIWASPVFTVNRLLFAVGMTLYVLIGIRHEERDLVREFGEEYENYREEVGGLLPTQWVSGKNTG